MIKITQLMDNNLCGKGIESEHGLSYLIETKYTKAIFDTGESLGFLKNAAALGEDMKNIDYVILSHGHSDHTGGFESFVKIFGNDFILVASPGLFMGKHKVDEGSIKYIGNHFDHEILSQYNIEMLPVENESIRISKKMYVINGFERKSEFEEINPHLIFVDGNRGIIDEFRDETCLVLDNDIGLTVIVGCSHPGIVNILETIREKFNKKIYALYGGIHLKKASKLRISKTVDYIKALNIEKIELCHCSGEKIMQMLNTKD